MAVQFTLIGMVARVASKVAQYLSRSQICLNLAKAPALRRHGPHTITGYINKPGLSKIVTYSRVSRIKLKTLEIWASRWRNQGLLKHFKTGGLNRNFMQVADSGAICASLISSSGRRLNEQRINVRH
jgi:hypothetical protein